jgi:hypothetical protein
MKNSTDLLHEIVITRVQFAQPDLLDRETFIANLCFVYGLMVASEQLLREAVEHSKGALRAYCRDHLAEETGHEKWLAADLESAGVRVDRIVPSMEIAACAGAQYYLVRHVCPAALLGYMATLECMPMPIERVEKLEEVHGKTLCRTLRHHAIKDVDHGREVLAMIDRASGREFSLIRQNAIQTARYVGYAAQKFGKIMTLERGGSHVYN